MDTIRRLLEVLEGGALPSSLGDDSVQDGLKKLVAVLATVEVKLQHWSRHQLEQLLSILNAFVSASWDLRADEEQSANLEQVYAHIVKLCVGLLESRSSSGFSFSDDQIHQRALQLLEAATIEGKAVERFPSTCSSGELSLEILDLMGSDFSDDVHYSPKSDYEEMPKECPQNILALLSRDQLLADEFTHKVSSVTGRCKLLVNAAQHCAITQFSSVQRLLALCWKLLQCGDDQECEDKEFNERVLLASRVLTYLVDLTKAAQTRDYVEGATDEMMNILVQLDRILKLSCVAELEDMQEGSQLLPPLLDAVIRLSEVLHPDQIFSRGLRTFFAASILDAMDDVDWRQENLRLACTPQLVSYFLILLQNAQFHSSGSKFERKDLSAAVSLRTCRLRLQEYAVNQMRSRDEQLQVVFSREHSWLGSLVYVAANHHVQGLKVKPSMDMASVHSEEDSATISMDSLTVTSEDDALFGDLFSESGRHSVNSEETLHASSCAKKVEEFHNSHLQATSQLLCFLKDYIFFPEWHRQTFEVACGQISATHLDVLLQIHHSQSILVDKHTTDDVGSERSSDVVVELHKCSFDLLFALVDREALSNSLQVHLFNQLLKEGELQLLSGNVLVIVAKLLVKRFQQQGTVTNDPLIFELWNRFQDTVLNKVRSCRALESDIDRISSALPSWFHMEVLFMAFHSLDTSGRSLILRRLLKSIAAAASEKENAGSSLVAWSLLTSRLVLALKYIVGHFSSFSKWLVVDLSKKLQYETGEANLSSVSTSAAAVFARHIQEASQTPAPHVVDEHFIEQLHDVECSEVDNAASQILSECTTEDMVSIKAVLCDVLEAWAGKSIKQVRELILERYLFGLCWSVLNASGLDSLQILPWDVDSKFRMETFFGLSRSFSDGFRQQFLDVAKWAEFLISAVANLQNSFLEGRVNLATWDQLRLGAFLALILLPLQSKHGNLVGSSSSDTAGFFQVIQYIIDCGFADNLLENLTSICAWYVEAINYSVSNILKQYSSSHEDVSSASLLLRAGLSKDERSDLLRRGGVNVQALKVLFRWGSSVSWQAAGGRMLMITGSDTLFLPVLLHGYPYSAYQESAVFASCMLSLESMLELMDKLVKAKRSSGLKIESVEKLLGTTMAMKITDVCESLHSRCDSLLASIFSTKEEQTLYTDLYLLKHVEDLLQLLCAKKEVSQREGIIMQAVDLMNEIRVDSSRCEALRLRFCIRNEKIASPGSCTSMIGLGSFSSFVDVLDGRFNEMVNLKALQFLVDLLNSPSNFQIPLRCHLQNKFMSMQKEKLGVWLEQRFLCKDTDSPSAASVRDWAGRFVQSVVVPSSQDHSKEMTTHILSAMLMKLEDAFVHHDAASARSYFGAIVQLATGHMFLKQVTSAVMEVMGKLGSDHLEGLKLLISFLNSVLQACGAQKALFQTRFSNQSSQGLQPMKSKAVARREHVFQGTAESGADCDATSVDEDEDDATSDGEIGLDKEDDEDTSEKTLASRVCSFTSSGSNFMEQHWYFCYTCDLTVSKGCCSVCAKVCHRGHKVVYSRLSRFFCDCGAGGVRGSSCLCLKPRKFVSSGKSTGSGNEVIVSSDNHDRLQLSDSDSDTDADDCQEIDDLFRVHMTEQEDKQLTSVLTHSDLESLILSLCRKLQGSFNAGLKDGGSREIQLGKEKVVQIKSDILQLKRAYKSGSLDMKIKADYLNARELRSHLVSGSIVKSLLTISTRGRLAAGEGDKVTIFDVAQLIGQPTATTVTVDKTTVKPLSKNSVRFELVQLIFNPANECYLAVAGYEDCIVFTLNTRGEVTDRLALELALQDAYIRRIAWVPGSQVELMVVTNKFVKIYDLSQDSISPMHYFTVPEDRIIDAALIPLGQNQILAMVLSQQGLVYCQTITAGGDSGACVLAEIVQLPKQYRSLKGTSIFFSLSFKLLFMSFSDGLSLIGRLTKDDTLSFEVSSLVEAEQEGKTKAAGLHHWKEIFDGSGLFTCLSSHRSNSAAIAQIGTNSVHLQPLRVAGNSTSLRVDGIASSVQKERSHVLVLYDDGSLHVFSLLSTSIESSSGGIATSQSHKQTPHLEAEQLKKLGSALLTNRASISPVFPLDFFEKTTCITADVKLAGDILRNSDFDGVKLSLASEDGFLESPSTVGFKILVLNSNPDIVMVGCRVHVGNTSASHIPSELRIFQRSIKVEEGVRSWYDIPFTSAESLLADEEFTFAVGPSFNGTSLSRIDNFEVYGRSKEDFGWKEKLDAVLDSEKTQISSGDHSGPSKGAASNLKWLQSAPILEQVFYECFKLLSGFYLLCRNMEGFSLDKSREKCLSLLEVIVESDRHSPLQSAARRVVRSLSPSKESYYQAKDMMFLSAVARFCPLLASKLNMGGTRMGWIVQEFMSQVRTVCKVSLHRPHNLAIYLERNGASVVDGLVDVLWKILISDQLDAQTINDLVVLTADLIYGYAECLTLHSDSSLAPAIDLLRKLLFAPADAVRSSCSLALSSRLLQVPLPKQTMLSMDDAESSRDSRAGSLHSEGGTSTVSGQVMLDEDVNAASVQYCCDGCSTVPILRRRWHCNVCPDFDLCEACYEVMDADQLPQPHSRDHSMSAIPIEADSGGDNGDTHFTSIDDMSDECLLQMATELSLQTSASVDTVNEPSEFPESIMETKQVSSSSSKAAVNSLILDGLLESIRGWSKTISGTTAVPVMQLFYRLASAPCSPLVENSGVNLEKLVTVILDELDLGSSLLVKSRSNYGEVTVLVFMFFTLLLRQWHHPGFVHVASAKDEKPGNALSLQYDRACAALRQQSLVSFLLNIVQQLSHVFKSSSKTVDANTNSATAPCGALLVVKRDFAAGSFTPFFSDSYAKSHRGDLFGEFHRLLLDSAFRLTYSLIRPGKSEKMSDKEQALSKGCPGPDLRLDGWQEVLCSYINNPHTSFVRKYARRLLLHICATKGHYYNVRDAWQLNREVKKLYKLVNKSGGFQSTIPYERSVKILKCLSLIGEAATARPRNWQKYCLRHADVIPFLLNGSFCFGEELVVQTLKLLALVFFTGKEAKKETVNSSAKGGKEKKSGSDESSSVAEKMEQAVEQLAGDDGKNLRNFVDAFLLEWNAVSVRTEAKAVLSGAWHHGGHAFRVLLLTLLLERVQLLPSYGQNIQEFNELMSWLLKKGTQDVNSNNQESVLVQGSLTGSTIKKIVDTLRLQNELLANHPNSRIYSTLASLVEFDGYYLESEPCLACSSPEVPYTRMKLDSIKSETKFTDNRILVKCIGSHTIQSVTMNVHDARRSKSVKVLNLYYNNRVVADLSELKNNRSLWKRARSCHLNFGQAELKVEFPIPITACNFMIELDSFYENLQAASLESLQCPRCSRYVTDKHGICSNCHENAYQCRQCRNINYENLDSFLCNECGYSKYGRFEFNFMAKPSFTFDSMENDEDMKKGLAAIETESENAHRRYQQLLGYKKPLLKLVSSIGESELDSQQKDSVQQMIVSLPGSSSFKINRKIAILGVLYGEKCKMAFDSVSKSVQTLQGLRRVLMSYLERKTKSTSSPCMLLAQRHPNRCFGCANTFVGHCLEWLQMLAKIPYCRQQLVAAGILSEVFENNIHQGPKSARVQARTVLAAFIEGDAAGVAELNNLITQKVMYCLEHHRSMDIAACVRDEMQLLSETCSLSDDFWEARLRVVFLLLFRSIQVGARHPVIAEYIILPSLRIISQACTPPKAEPPVDSAADESQRAETKTEVKSDERIKVQPTNNVHTSTSPTNGKNHPEKDVGSAGKGSDMLLVNYVEWKNGVTYLDFVRRQFTVSQTVKPVQQKASRKDPQRANSLALKYMLRWKRRACKSTVTSDLKSFEDSTWVRELVLSACSQPIRQEMCALIELLCSQSIVRRSKFLDLLMSLLPATRIAGESAAEYFELLFKMIEPEDSRLYLTVRGVLKSACALIAEEVTRIEAQERSYHTDISQGYILNKLIELLSKFLQVPNIRARFMKEELLSQVLEALLVIRGLVVQKTKLITDCGRLLRELLDNLLQESYENKRHFIRACVSGLQVRHNRKDRRSLFILEQLCNIICPEKPEPVYMMILNKAHTQEEFIRGSMNKNPYSSLEVGPLMRDVKNKICLQLELIGLLEDDYGMELLVAGNIISLDLTVVQVFEQVWRKAHNQAANIVASTLLAAPVPPQSAKECPPMTVTYRLQGLDGEATEPMIKELDDDREEMQDPEVEFAITGVMKECSGLEVVLKMIQQFSDDELKSAHEEVCLVVKLLMFCCKIRGNRQALLRLGALDVLLEIAHRAFSSAEPAEGLLLIVESLVTEANESDGVVDSTSLSASSSLISSSGGGGGRGEQAAKGVHMFLERMSNPSSYKSSKQHRNSDTVARILPYLTYGEQAAMEVLVDHFNHHLQDWAAYDALTKQHSDNPKDSVLAHKAAEEQVVLENFVKMTESIKLNASGERLKNLIMDRHITTVAVRYLQAAFPRTNEGGNEYKGSSKWAEALEMSSVPIILSMLRGLSRGHQRTQQCLDDEEILPLLHALESVSGENEIGARAENLLDTLASKSEGFLNDKVINLRDNTRDEMRRRALQRREALLQGMGMRRELRSDGGERIVISSPSIEGLDEVEEEEAGLACMVCREGYKLRPTDMLGTYSYSKRVNVGPSAGRAEWVYTTVSHFNVIHFQCHQEAKRADLSLKNPKKEWEGAALRNSETLCNNIFPLRGPVVPLAQYSRCVDTFWDNLNALGRADGSRLRLLTYDIVLMLGRFATGASFSADSKGGGKESNSKLLPFMIQMARHLLDQQPLTQRRTLLKSLQTYLSPSSSTTSPSPSPSSLSPSPSPSPDTVAGEGGGGGGVATSRTSSPSPSPSPSPSSSSHHQKGEESVHFMMVQSLLLHSYEEWLQYRRIFFQKGAVHAYMLHRASTSGSSSTSTSTSITSLRSPFDFTAIADVKRASSSPPSDLVSQSLSQSQSQLQSQSQSQLSSEELFTVLEPMLVYIGIVDELQSLLKKKKKKMMKKVQKKKKKKRLDGGDDEHDDDDDGHDDDDDDDGHGDDWESLMKERTKDVSGMLMMWKELLERIEELKGCEDIEEAMDVMGALCDALSSFTSCEHFFRDALTM